MRSLALKYNNINNVPVCVTLLKTYGLYKTIVVQDMPIIGS